MYVYVSKTKETPVPFSVGYDSVGVHKYIFLNKLFLPIAAWKQILRPKNTMIKSSLGMGGVGGGSPTKKDVTNKLEHFVCSFFKDLFLSFKFIQKNKTWKTSN